MTDIQIVVTGQDATGGVLKQVSGSLGEIDARAQVANSTLSQSALRVRETSLEFASMQKFGVSALATIASETATTNSSLGRVVNTLAKLGQAYVTGGKVGVVSEAALMGLKALISHLNQTDQAAQRARTSLAEVGAAGAAPLTRTAAAASLTRQEFSRLGIYATQGLYVIGSEASKTNQQLGDMIAKATHVGEAFLFGNVAGAAMMAAAIGVGALVSEMNRLNEEMKKALEPYDEMRTALVEMGKLQPALAQGLVEHLGLTREQALAVTDLAGQSEIFRRVTIAEIDAGEELERQELKVKSVREALGVAETNLATNTEPQMQASLERIVAVRRQQVYDEEIALNKQKQAVATHAEAVGKYAEKMAGNVTHEQHKLRLDTATTNALWEAQGQTMKANEAAAKRYADALEAVAKAQRQIVTGMLEKAFTPTEVTQADVDAGAAYIDQWDEWRRRAEAVAQGTSPEQYGEQFAASIKKAMERTGLGAGDLAKQFKDFSLFGAHPEFITDEFLNMDAIEASIEQQMNAFVGKADVMEAAYAKVWDKIKLDPVKAKKLEKMGIAEAPDSWAILTGQKAGTISVMASPDMASKLAEIQSMITSNIPPELYTTVHVTYVIDKPGGGGTEDTGGGGGDGTGTDTSGHHPNDQRYMQEGGMGVLSQDTMIYAHKGEGYWFSGTPWRVAPPGGGHVATYNVQVGGGASAREDRKRALQLVRLLKRYGPA